MKDKNDSSIQFIPNESDPLSFFKLTLYFVVHCIIYEIIPKYNFGWPTYFDLHRIFTLTSILIFYNLILHDTEWIIELYTKFQEGRNSPKEEPLKEESSRVPLEQLVNQTTKFDFVFDTDTI